MLCSRIHQTNMPRGFHIYGYLEDYETHFLINNGTYDSLTWGNWTT